MNCDYVEAKPVTFDGSDLLDENCEGWTAYEWMECPACHHGFCVVGHGSFCPECDAEIYGADGPMMNYAYPINVPDLEAAARKIKDLPLCLVEMKDGAQYLALTGGGMDLSTEIIRAYIALGYLPPVHFRPADSCGWENHRGMVRVLRLCAESAKCAAQWANNHLSRIREMQARQRRVRKASKVTKLA